MKKLLAIVLSLAVTISLALPTQALTTAAAKKTFKNKNLEFYMFQGGWGKSFEEAVVKNFEKAYGVKVTLVASPRIGDKLRTRMVAGKSPDVILFNWNDSTSAGINEALQKERGFMDLTPMLNEKALDSSSKLADQFLPGFLDSIKCSPYQDGKVYLLPLFYSPTGLMSNKTYMDKNGYKAPKTWDEFFKLGDTIKKNDGRALFTYQGIYPGYLEELIWPAIAGAVGAKGVEKIFNYQAGSFKNATVKKVLTNIQNIAKNGYLMEGTVAMNHTQSQSAMMMGKAAFITNGTWMDGEMKDAPREDGFKFQLSAPPALTASDKQYSFTSIETIYIPATAKNPELAKEFLKFLFTKDSQKLAASTVKAVMPIKGSVELNKSTLPETTLGYYSMFDQGVLPLVSTWASLPAGSKINMNDEVFNKPMTKVMNGQMTVDQWMDDVEKAMAQCRADLAKAAAEE
jgi:N-acetylglucosamine transport system substrate-binding protein